MIFDIDIEFIGLNHFNFVGLNLSRLRKSAQLPHFDFDFDPDPARFDFDASVPVLVPAVSAVSV